MESTQYWATGREVDLEERVLVLAPTARDAAMSQSILAEAELECRICAGMAELVQELDRGAGAILLTEEVLVAEDPGGLVTWVQNQPAWSDLPVLLLCGDGADSPAAIWAMEWLGNATILERPVRLTTLVSSVRSALKARRRQYELGSQMEVVHESEELLRTITRNATTAIFMMDAMGQINFMNPAAEEMTGFTFAELRGRTLDDLLRRTRADGCPDPVENCTIRQHILGERPLRNHEDVFFRKDGTSFPVRCAARPIRKGETLAGTVLEVLDITEQRRTLEALRDADRRKDEFLATLSHELRNPLAPIRNSVQLLGKVVPADPQLQKLRTMMERQLSHMVRLVDDLLEVSRITRGKIELQCERLDLSRVVESAVETSAPLIDGAGHRLTVLKPREPVMVEGDSVRLTQVVTNLLNNAAKYTSAGGDISVSVEARDREALIHVRDNGPGIPPEMLPRIFDLFAQVHGTQSRSQGGLGIGLALVKRLVEMHKGSIEARSTIGDGSEFIIRLPRVKAWDAMSADRSVTVPPVQSSRRRVLIVDDNVDAADSLSLLLTVNGHEVRTAYDGPTGIQQAADFRPDFVLLDLGMPGMDGYQTARKVREIHGLDGLKLLALTGWSQGGDRRRTQEAGFDGHLVKPVDLAILERILSEFPQGAIAAPVER